MPRSLNEIDDRRPSQGRHQAMFPARALKMNWAYDPNSRNRCGNAVLSSFPIGQPQRFSLPSPEGTA